MKEHFVSAGMCADVCVHDKNDGNPHAHILLTMRPFEPDKTWGAKSKKEYFLDENGERIKLKSGEFKNYKINTVDWNEQTKAEEWRSAWAQSVNAVLEKQGVDECVDHRSFERQGLEQIPTVHMGVAASQMEQRGIITERGNQNRKIAHNNGIIFAISAKLKQLKDWLKTAFVSDVKNDGTEKPSVMAQLNNYKNEIKEIERPEPSALADLYERFDVALKKLRQIDVRLKNANGAAEYDKILPERHKAYAEYSALKSEVKNAENHVKKRTTHSKKHYER